MWGKARNIRKLLVMSAGLSGMVLPISSHAEIIMIYANNKLKPVISDMQTAASLLKSDLNTSGAASESTESFFQSKGFGYRVSKNPAILTSDFSLRSDMAAYIWSDDPFEWGPGFELQAGATADFETTPYISQALEKTAFDPKAGENLVAKTTLLGVSLNGLNLRVSYAMSKPGTVSTQVFGANGENMGKWSWKDASPGTYSRDLSFNNAQGNHLLFVHWSSGTTHSVQKVLVRDIKTDH